MRKNRPTNLSAFIIILKLECAVLTMENRVA
jgi:hypothetical protein